MREVEHYEKDIFDFSYYRDKIHEHHSRKFKKLEQILDRYDYLFEDQKHEKLNVSFTTIGES